MSETPEASLTPMEERLSILENCTVRPGGEPERKCRQLITVVMSTFSTRIMSVIMFALMSYPERTKLTASQLAKELFLDTKQIRNILSKLKGGGYIIEGSTQIDSIANKQKRHGQKVSKQATYHVDYEWFIMMCKYRLSQILKRLNSRESKENETEKDGYVCPNELLCPEAYKKKNIIDLIMNTRDNNYATDGDSHFKCAICKTSLVHSDTIGDSTNKAYEIKRKFNDQIKMLRLY